MPHVLRSRLTLDLASAGLLLLAMAYHWQGNAFHEFVGTGMFGLVAAHNVYNRRWWGALAKPRAARRGALHTVMTLGLLGAMLVLLVTGVMISETVLAGLSLDGDFTTRQVHGFVGYWVLVFVAVHVGLRWTLVMAATRALFGMTPGCRLRTGALRVAAVGVIVAGAYSASALGVLARLMFEMSLDWWNFDDSALGFFAHCLLFAGAVVGVTHYGSSLAPSLR